MTTLELDKTRTLFVFDFDHTLVDDNSDTWIFSLCPKLNLHEKMSSKRREFDSWTKFMDHVFSLLHQQGCTEDEITQHMKKLRLHEQGLKTLHAVHKSATADAIIISDANTFFIDTILKECGVRHMVDLIISNPARFNEKGRLHVEEYHNHHCKNCKRTPNLCKGQALTMYLESHGGYKMTVYVGDGKNDFCPTQSMNPEDVVICREGYGLASLLKQASCGTGNVYFLDFITSLGDFISEKLLRD